jgi:hypothetical protein
MHEPQLGAQEGAKRLVAAEELPPRIMSHTLASMEGVLDRQGPIWDMIRQDPLRLSDQAVFRDGSVLAWSLGDGWAPRRGEHSPFPFTRLIRHDGRCWHWLERMAGEDGASGDWCAVRPVHSGEGYHGGA